MSVKQIGLTGLCWLLCGLGCLRAQGPAAGPEGQSLFPLVTPFSGNNEGAAPNNPVTSPTSAGPLAFAFVPAPAGVNSQGIANDEGTPPPPPPNALIPLGPPTSPYLNYPRSPCCCGPVGKCGGPFGYDVFARSGMAFPIGNSIFDKYLRTGWDVEGGARLYMFNPPSTAAWVATMSISNIYSRIGSSNQSVILDNVTVHVPSATPDVAASKVLPEIALTVSSLNMTFVNLGFGREWWLHGSADPGQQQHCWNWRAGFDGGGRYGSAEVQFDQIQHHTDVVGGIYAALHSDVEWPFRCGIGFAGVRLEYNYIWTSLLQDQNNGDFSSLNLLFQLGVRF